MSKIQEKQYIYKIHIQRCDINVSSPFTVVNKQTKIMSFMHRDPDLVIKIKKKMKRTSHLKKNKPMYKGTRTIICEIN